MKRALSLLGLIPLLAACGTNNIISSEGTSSELAVSTLSEETSSKPIITESSEEEEKAIFCLNITRNPDKMDYFTGDYFDPTGMEVQVEYEDGTTKDDVPFRVLTSEPLSKTNRTVRVAYKKEIASIDVNVTSSGNKADYDLDHTAVNDSSPLKGKKLFFLGSSVTYGAGSGGVAFPEYLAKKDGTISVKEAVSGTTLADVLSKDGGKSYVTRFKDYIEAHPDESFDGVVVQLSTNDVNYSKKGQVLDEETKEIDAFDVTSTYGAIEYIIALAKQTYSCPVLFYTNHNYGINAYGQMVDTLFQIAQKWDIGVLDLYHDEEVNTLSEEERERYLEDAIHPTKAGYRDWWLPHFESGLISVLGIEENK